MKRGTRGRDSNDDVDQLPSSVSADEHDSEVFDEFESKYDDEKNNCRP